MKITKKTYIQSFLLVVVALAMLRAFFPSIAMDEATRPHDVTDSTTVEASRDTITQTPASIVSSDTPATPTPHKIYSVAGYSSTFPDTNDIQLVAANQWGVSPVENRAEAERRKMELVYVGSNPYYFVNKLYSSIPYLVPRAASLLQELGQNFYDSLQVKGIPLHKIIVTSALRSKEDVARLQRHNSNATPNSCHLRGTTFDVSYNKYKTVAPPGEERREVRNDTLKFVLSETLRDLREQGRCYVKYERKQGCFHITVR